ncbi:glycosyl transferase family 9 [Geobacter metallireducens RCH3]|uniref:ADP-heptose--lipopolysaccharide heptosyltransferase, putative n=1 Tax=Geobacter metallireducens (strain ATCC 53774 / DSM 7210 / GS-15) TaxID=269799 RepID=Q39Y46_GEOMG|nr:MULTISPECIES: glycosyltransferase family 9 protein [Geobacter]ABB30828.1 ADP-heptose--lipopolysaccharide heptosyltransferase, putative [Geobacter metallireducens GS-15]EHP88241.1 glycosyl transferase family 9 [Geobacter metallireducens RCH3]MBT1075399.1 glycosyltransferase family 9 protein [Geobacter grbiciae]
MNWKLIRIIDVWLGIPILFGIFVAGRLFGKRQPQRPATVRRILLIKFWGIGNLFMMLPSVQALRAAHPAAAIDVLSLDSNRDAIRACGVFDGVATITTAGPLRFLLSWRRAVALLRRNRYDIIIDFEQFARFSALVAGQIGAAEIIGFRTEGQHRSLNFTVQVPYDNAIHVTRSFHALVAAAGAAPVDRLPAAGISGSENLRERGKELLAQIGIGPDELCVVMHAGTSGNFSERRWPPERFSSLADTLHAGHNARTIFTGAAEEAFLTREAARHLHRPLSALDLGGKLKFRDYLALIAAADLVVSADTAAVHMASAVGTPVVGLYGPNTPRLYGPWGRGGVAVCQGLDCSPCITNFNAKLHVCRHPAGRGACMGAIGVEDVAAAIRRNFLEPDAPFLLTRLSGGMR